MIRRQLTLLALLLLGGRALAGAAPPASSQGQAAPVNPSATELVALQARLAVTPNSAPERPELLFWLGNLLSEAKRLDEARAAWYQLIQNYPQSAFVAHAYLALGEAAFEKADLPAALNFYNRVLENRQSAKLADYVRYKKGWVFFNLGDFPMAQATFIEVIEKASGPRASTLMRAAQKDLVRTFAQRGPVEQAWPLFKQHGGALAPTMMEWLGEIYTAEGKLADSSQTYRTLIRLIPDLGKQCEWQASIVRNTRLATGPQAVADTRQEVHALLAAYDKAPTALLCRDQTNKILAELTIVWHQQTRQTDAPDTYARTADLYREYLRRFAGDPGAYLVTFYYGELLYRLGDLDKSRPSAFYCEAAPIYASVVRLDPHGSKLQEAAYAALMATRNCLEIKSSAAEAGPGGHPADSPSTPQPIPDKQQKWLNALADYMKSVGESPELVNVKYSRARVLYEYHHYGEALPLFRDIAEHHNSGRVAVSAATLALDCLAARHDTKGGAQAVDEFLAVPELTRDAEFKAQLQKLKEISQQLAP